MKRVIVFTGPSLHPREASRILKAEYHPPVGRGDVSRFIRETVDVIAIIDGVFHQEPAVAHKEIIEALKRDVKVVGGASMGALRASELDNLGMIGIGYVYRKYKDGSIESDDDVAVAFDPKTLEPLSDSLVSIRYNFKRAYKRGIISKGELENLIKTAKSIFYPKRTYERIYNKSNLDPGSLKGLREFIESEGVDIKKEDAIKVLEYVKENLL
ncbi:MAG TPA: TfuA-related McrA-glycine thioamidation protein [Methanothermobacter sp.]|nr:TfuA-like core domain-containing protein [Methanothermobacter sp. MT-2]HHW05400.1 TfuA-related McrA-glycine thioamidation protein [Methanothermobacter sp.]HOK73155.1 TfuA-related McrA-glycine thioamidation protein [Methanothermobacter sp.]HOL68787.1 TfuA-related McrA-glycine thioamidation protein [Methanothermobacter sp.]HPQ04680.1 TfuA-related McrA-glycine thioamidation protein [Methanothermobacter sp.]